MRKKRIIEEFENAKDYLLPSTEYPSDELGRAITRFGDKIISTCNDKLFKNMKGVLFFDDIKLTIDDIKLRITLLENKLNDK